VRPKSAVGKAPARVFSRSQKAPRPAGAIRPGLFYGSFAALLGTNVLTLVGFLMAPDIAGMMNGQNEVVFAAYEDRIAELRVEVDRLHSRQYAQAGDINLQLQELTQQQEVLLEQHQYVKQLAEKASELGIVTAGLRPPVEGSEAEVLVTGALSGAPRVAADEIEAAADSLRGMMEDSRLALAAISEAADASTDEIVAELGEIGLRPVLPETDAVGGPFLPAIEGPDSLSIVDDANAVVASLARFKAARGAIDVAPIHRPIAGSIRMSSGYGNRKDPFTRRKAFHAGVDFPAPTGTTVLAAGNGKVIFAGKKSGYGNVVEVEHTGGLITRYAHLSAFIVKEGQSVSTGTPIARVGSTGRSTGPHLHFEVRRKDSAVDPGRYLAAGKRLMRFLAS
jgi:murein DD-endopeptidase MepM/ murein hydrolase activator NlpD